MNPLFKVEAEQDGTLCRLSIVGELDQGTAPQLREQLTSALVDQRGSVLVDLGECNFIDSTGLSLLVEAKRKLAGDERRFAVCCPDADVRRLLELTGIDQAVGLYETRDAAAAALA